MCQRDWLFVCLFFSLLVSAYMSTCYLIGSILDVTHKALYARVWISSHSVPSTEFLTILLPLLLVGRTWVLQEKLSHNALQ